MSSVPDNFGDFRAKLAARGIHSVDELVQRWEANMASENRAAKQRAKSVDYDREARGEFSGPMSFGNFEGRVSHLVATASPAVRLEFARQTITFLRQFAEAAIAADLTDDERAALRSVSDRLETESPDVLRHELQSICADEDGALDSDSYLIEYLSALDHFVNYRQSADPEHVFALAMNHMTCIDVDADAAGETSPMNDFLAVPQMRAEYQRIVQSLRPAEREAESA